MADITEASVLVEAIVLPQYVISYRYKHGTDLIAATGDNVRILLDRAIASSRQLEETIALLDEQAAKPDSERVAVFGHRWLWGGLAAVLDDNPGNSAAINLFHGNFKDKRTEAVAIGATWENDLLTWLVLNDTHPDGARGCGPVRAVRGSAAATWASVDLLELTQRVYEGLPFLADVRARVGAVRFVSSDVLSQARDCRQLRKARWNPEVLNNETRGHNVLARYVRLANEIVGNQFELECVEKTMPAYDF